jgi:intein/homing endonuclease
MSYWDKIHKNLDKNLDDSHEIINTEETKTETKFEPEIKKKLNDTLYLNLKEDTNTNYELSIKNGSAGETLAGHESVASDEDKVLNWTNEKGLYYAPVKRIIRHKVSKERWKLTTESGKEVIVTGDHSLIVLLKDMLHPDKSKRPLMRTAADHSYFKRNKIGTFRKGYNKSRSISGGTGGGEGGRTHAPPQTQSAIRGGTSPVNQYAGMHRQTKQMLL